MRIVIVFAWALLASHPARSDVINATPGTPVALHLNHPRVRLLRERVHAVVYYDHCDMEATYEFHNLGAATTVTMAFPESGPELDYNAEKPGFVRFQARIGERVLATRRSIQGSDTSYPNDIVRHVAKVHFARGQRRRIRMRSRSAPFEGLAFGADFVYLFGRFNWHGQVRESTIAVEFRVPNTYIAHGYQGADRYFKKDDAVPLTVKGRSCIFSRRNWYPRGRFNLAFYPTLVPGWLSYRGADRFERTIMVPGKPRGIKGALFWLPPALVRGGVTFIKARELLDRLDLPRKQKRLSWEQKTKLAELHAGQRALRFGVGAEEMQVDGRSVALPSAPFTAWEWGHDLGKVASLYVPLSPVARAIGGSFSINLPAHRFDLTGQRFVPPEEP